MQFLPLRLMDCYFDSRHVTKVLDIRFRIFVEDCETWKPKIEVDWAWKFQLHHSWASCGRLHPWGGRVLLFRPEDINWETCEITTIENVQIIASYKLRYIYQISFNYLHFPCSKTEILTLKPSHFLLFLFIFFYPCLLFFAYNIFCALFNFVCFLEKFAIFSFTFLSLWPKSG